jgi:hypothetical protein
MIDLSKVPLIADYQDEWFYGCTFPKEVCDQLKKLSPDITDDILADLASLLGKYRVTGFDNNPKSEESQANDGKTGQELRGIRSAIEQLNSLIQGGNQRTIYLLEQAYYFKHKTSGGVTHRGCPTLDDARLVLRWLEESISESAEISNLVRTGRGRRPGGANIDNYFLLDEINRIVYQNNKPMSQSVALNMIEILNLEIPPSFVKRWRLRVLSA